MTEKTEKNRPKAQSLRFKAEVAQLLEIVVNSLYTDRDIFVRELISNGSDALEKMRHLELVEKSVYDQDTPLEIRIDADEQARTFTITDTGLGMTREEASRNLGTIAHSGSREFLKRIAKGGQVDATLIGQFGVGFYSAFMVAEKVTVESRSSVKKEKPVTWSSKGTGSYSVAEGTLTKRGTKITINLKDDAKEFTGAERIKHLIRRWSNFVPFPIFVNGEQVNTVEALWTRSPSEVKDEDLAEFYKFIANSPGEPTYSLHFSADAPLAIHSLLFVPAENIEKLGFARTEPGVALYCRKILIQQQAEELLPDYFRFIRGVVDSDDLPLNISRETMQDSALVAKLKRVLTGRLIKFFDEQAKSDPEKYDGFFREFGAFIKEGVSSDFEHREKIAKLLRFESSAGDKKLVSLKEYAGRMKDDQQAIYYISGHSREAIEAGPYVETLNARGLEVLYCYEGIDDFVMTALHEFDGKKLISADQSDLDLPEVETPPDDGEGLDEKQAGDLARWIKEALGDRVEEVRVSKRLVRSPAVLVNPDEHLTTGMQRVMQTVAKDTQATIGRQILEINPGHTILRRLNDLREDESQKEFATEAALLLYDNAMISAGLLVDPKVLVERSTRILERAVSATSKSSGERAKKVEKSVEKGKITAENGGKTAEKTGKSTEKSGKSGQKSGKTGTKSEKEPPKKAENPGKKPAE